MENTMQIITECLQKCDDCYANTKLKQNSWLSTHGPSKSRGAFQTLYLLITAKSISYGKIGTWTCCKI